MGIFPAYKKGKIFVKNSNVQFHIMQRKHAWGNVVKITGNTEKDFAKVIALLEENNVTEKAYLIGNPQLFPENFPKIKKAIHEKKIMSYLVHTEFETNIETGITFLQDAWVVTK